MKEHGAGPYWRLDLGATPDKTGGACFRVWAPQVQKLSVVHMDNGRKTIPLERDERGYFSGRLMEAMPGDRYLYLLDGRAERPDPASRFQPEGVHGPSEIVAPWAHEWQDSGWRGLPLEAYIIYELHVGVFTPEGTFDGVISRLDYLCELGVTAVELLPVAQFPGSRNWGYDGVYPFAPQNSYGGPDGLKRLVDACHRRGLAVILDVVYNHLGPEGNYLHGFGPYFTDRYRTPWGDAVNFDGPDSDPVRHYFVSNARYWISEFHIDALRLDAVHGIYDFGARHILRDMADAVHRQGALLGRHCHVMAESDQNDARLVTPPELGGYGLDAQWNDDFHHALRSLLTGDRDGYYADFGRFGQLVTAFRDGFVYTGGYSRYRRRRHGSPSAHLPADRMVVFSQNHDQVGNRMRGERPGEHLTMAQLKLAAAAVILSPALPLLFMGEEYGETSPFPYFVHHGDHSLVEAVRRGREEEFSRFSWQGSPPDPQDAHTFRSARLNLELCRQEPHRSLFEAYRELIRLRKTSLPLARLDKDAMTVCSQEDGRLLSVLRRAGTEEVLCLFNFSDSPHPPAPCVDGGNWRLLFDSAPGEGTATASTEALSPIAPWGVRVFAKEDS